MKKIIVLGFLLLLALSVVLADENTTADRLEKRAERVEAVGERVAARQTALETRAALVRCQGNNSTECTELRAEVTRNAPEQLRVVAERILNALDKLEERIVSQDDANDAHVEALLRIIEKQRSEVQTTLDRVDALGDEATLADIRAAAQELRLSYAKTMRLFRHGVRVAIAVRMEGIIERAENSIIKLESAETRLVEAGADTSELSPMIDAYEEHVSSARESYEAAREIYQDVESVDDLENAGEQIRRHVDETKNQLMDARTEVRDILREVRRLAGVEVEE